MQLTVFNGSPRAERSNTRLLLGWFVDGLRRVPGSDAVTFNINRRRERARQVEAFAAASEVLLAFPLYHDAMPSIVMGFIEDLAPLRGCAGNPGLSCLVQSGFPEAHNSRFVERYLEKLARRLGCPYRGTIVRGGVEGIQAKPAWMNRRIEQRFKELGEQFARSGALDPARLARLARPERLSAAEILLFQGFKRMGLVNAYWELQLRRHGATARSRARPYLPEE